jgi:hypothetical protein
MYVSMYVYTIYTRPRSIEAQYSRSFPIVSCSCYNGSLVTWTIGCLAAKFKPIIFRNTQIIYKDPVRTSQETHYVSATKPNRLTLLRDTIAVFCENHTKHMNILFFKGGCKKASFPFSYLITRHAMKTYGEVEV